MEETDMPFVQVQAQLPVEELLKAIRQLSEPELDHLVQLTLALRAQRRAPSLPQAEAELLQEINQSIPTEIQQRYDVLITKRKVETLTPEEHAELLQLTDRIENLEAQRMMCLAELAQLRQTSLGELMEQLDIQSPEYA